MPKENPTRLSDLYSGENKMNPMDIVVQKGFNVRDFSSEVTRREQQELEDSIEQNGVLAPVTVRPERDEKGVLRAILVDGERRYRAVLALIKRGVEIKSIPVQAESSRGLSEADRIASMHIRNTGLRFTPMELSQLVVRLLRHGWTEPQIAQKLSFSPAYVNNLVKMAEAPGEVKKLISEGAVSPAMAVEMIREHGPKAAEVIREVIATVKEEAVLAGKAEQPVKVSARTVKAAREAKARKQRARNPDQQHRYSQADAKNLVAAIQNIYSKTDGKMRTIRKICTTVLENYGEPLVIEEF